MSIKNKHREKNEYKVMGMEVGLLLEDAEAWWDSKGREMLKARQFSDEFEMQQAALDATNPVHPNYIGGKSNILIGAPWIMLSAEERFHVVKAYTITLKDMLDGQKN